MVGVVVLESCAASLLVVLDAVVDLFLQSQLLLFEKEVADSVIHFVENDSTLACRLRVAVVVDVLYLILIDDEVEPLRPTRVVASVEESSSCLRCSRPCLGLSQTSLCGFSETLKKRGTRDSMAVSRMTWHGQRDQTAGRTDGHLLSVRTVRTSTTP